MATTTKCQHNELLNSPGPGEHLIGVCRYCGRKRDYTKLQAKDVGCKQLILSGSLLVPGVNLSKLMGRMKKKEKKQGWSRGRVK